MSTTSTGKNLNLTIENLSGMEIELRPLEPGGGGWDISGKLFRGELYDELTDGKVGDIECLVTGEGRVVCRFPEMGRGRYSFAVFMSGGDGGETVFVDGYVGYSAPAATGGGFVDTVNRVVNVIVDGARRLAVYCHTSAAERAAERAEDALDGIGEQVARLDAVQEATDALRAGISNAVRINDYGRWQIGEVDSGVVAQGPAGQSGAEVQYHLIESEADLPTDAEHCSSRHRYIVNVEAAAAWMDVVLGAYPPLSGSLGVSINGTEYKSSSSDWQTIVAGAIESGDPDVHARLTPGKVELTPLGSYEAGKMYNLDIEFAPTSPPWDFEWTPGVGEATAQGFVEALNDADNWPNLQGELPFEARIKGGKVIIEAVGKWRSGRVYQVQLGGNADPVLEGGYIDFSGNVDDIILTLTAREEGAAGNEITVTAIGSSSFVNVPYPTLRGGSDGGLFQYVWADGQWVKLPLAASAIATPQSHGNVKLGTLGGSGDKVPVVEGLDGGLYCDRAPLATKLLAGMVKVAASMSSTTAVPLAKDAADYADGAAQDACDALEDTLHTYIAQQIASALATAVNVPTGGMVTYWGEEIPDGWLECDGSEVLRADYPDLFDVIGTAFGVPSSNTKFKLPDLRDRFVRYMGEDHETLGEKEEPSLPNITGSAGWVQNQAGLVVTEGALRYVKIDQAGPSIASGSGKVYYAITLNAHNSSSVYKAGETEVKVKSLVGKAIIKC